MDKTLRFKPEIDLTTVVHDDPDEPIVSVLSVSQIDLWDDWGRKDPFLIVVNPKDFSIGHDRGSNQLRQKHPWARDEEADLVMTAYLQYADATMTYAGSSTFKFTAWLIEAPQFWPKILNEKNPLVDAVRKDDSEDYYANAGYPYTPPKILGGKQGIESPMRIIMEYRVNTPEWDLNAYVDWMKKVANGED
jgi:hypothetical protein